MATERHHHDTHAIPPQAICDVFKMYQRMSDAEVDADLEIIDFQRGLSPAQKEKVRPVRTVSKEVISAAQRAFKFHGREDTGTREDEFSQIQDCTVYEHVDFDVQYPTSFFSLAQNSPDPRDRLVPKASPTPPLQHPNPNHTAIPKPLPISQFLHKKLHYLTVGSQYDWPTRSYPRETSTPFPSDIATLVTSLFGDFTPESG
ncbi:hypothetical protein DH86_00002888, partial [Scytalidium sp. 3C]